MRSNKPCLLLFFVCLLLFAADVTAQTSKAKLENKEMYFRIIAVKKITNDSIIALIDGGKKYGVQVGSTGPIKANNKYKDERSLLEIGFSSVITVNDTTSIISIKPVDKTGTKAGYDIRKSDYALLNIKVPVLPYHSTFFEFALLDCQFTNVHKEPLYAFEYLLYNDSKKVEDSIMNVAVADVKYIYDVLKDGDSTYNIFRVPLTEGRYKGRTIFDVMANCTVRDITAFLNFAMNYKGSYMGNTFKISETFATWVQNKALYSKKEVYDSVRLYMTKPQLLKQFIEKNIEKIKSEGFVTSWIDEASDAADNNKLKEAQELFETAKLFFPYLQSDCTIGYYYYNYTSVYKNKKDYTKTLLCYDTAYTHFSKCGNAYFMVQTLLLKGLTYNTMEKYDDALKTLDLMYAEMNKQKDKLKPNQITSFTAKYNHFSGIMQFVKGELKKAATHYENAIKNYKAMGDYSNLQSAIGVQGRLARLYKKQGELQKALEIYNERLALYSKLNDRKNIAETLDDIAGIEFELGNYRKAINDYSKAKELHLEFNNMNDAGFSQSNIGQAYWKLGKYDSAINSHNTALYYKKQAGSNAGQAYSWKKLGSLYTLAGEKSRALNAYDSSANYYALAKDSSSLKDLLTDVGDVYQQDKQYQKAFGYFIKVYNLNAKTKDKLDLANSLYNLGKASFYFDTDTSKKYFTNCYALAKEVGDKSNELSAGLNLGILSYKAFDFETGEKYFTNALAVAKSNKSKSQEANCYKLIALANGGKLDFDKALNFYQKAIRIYDSLGEKSTIPELYKNVANIYYIKGDFAESRKWFQKSIDMANSINSRADIGYAYSALSFLYIIQGELSKAEQAVDSTYSIFKSLNNSWQMADAYQNRGQIYGAKNDGINAVKYYTMADSIYKIEKDMYSQSICQTNIGCVFYYQADFDGALKYFYEADRMLTPIKAVTEAHVLAPINIGEAYYYKKDYVKAEPYLVKGYKLGVEKKMGRMQTIGASFLGTLYYDLKKYDLSEKYLLEGFALAQKSNETDLYINSGMYLGKLYSLLNQPNKAQEYYSKTINFIKTIDNSKYTWMALYEYGLNFYNNKNYDSASFYFKQAVQIVENSSQNLFGGAEAKKIYSADTRKVDLYNKLVASLAKTNNKSDAMYYAAQGNSQAVNEKVDNAGISTTDKAKAEALKKGTELIQKKTAIEQAIAKERAKPEKEQSQKLIQSLESVKNVTESEYTNFIDSLVDKYKDLSAYFVKANPADFEKYLKKIPPETAVLLYVINDSQLFIFTATNKETGIKIVDLKEDMNAIASRFLSVLRNPKNVTGTNAIVVRSTLKDKEDVRGDFKTEASILYDLLITPVKDVLEGKKSICVISNQKLSSIPFQSLGHIDDAKKFHFLIEDYNIFYTNQMDIFKTEFTPRKIQTSFAIFGNPDKSLPGATTEAQNISKIIPNSTLYIEDAATEEKATESLKKFGYVHFATHGVLDYADFNNSYLVFAPDKTTNSDGHLTIRKINGMKLDNNDLVMMSACETAVTKESVKGWYISPANSLLRKTVQTVIASLWKVDDEATMLLASEFYKNVTSMSRSEALRKAQATVSQNPKFSHPFFWSAFVLYGEWR